MDGKDLLKRYLDGKPKGSQAALAEEVGCTEGHLSAVKQGLRGVSVPLAMKIETATGGAVPARSLVGLSEDERETAQ